MRTCVIYAAAGILFFGVSTTAFADIVNVGDAQPAGGWELRFQEDGWYNGIHHNFDFFAVRIVSCEDSFRSPALSDFSVSGWQLMHQNAPVYPTRASAGGELVDSLQWDFRFAGDISNSLDLDFVPFVGTVRLPSTRLSWDGSRWSYGQGDWALDRSEWNTALADATDRLRERPPFHTPVPGAALLGVLGLACIGGWTARRAAR